MAPVGLVSEPRYIKPKGGGTQQTRSRQRKMKLIHIEALCACLHLYAYLSTLTIAIYHAHGIVKCSSVPMIDWYVISTCTRT